MEVIHINIIVKVKQAGKKRTLIDNTLLKVSDDIQNINKLIDEVVRTNVKNFNKKEIDKPIFKYLSKDDIEKISSTGKIGFNDKKNENIQDEEEAVENAIQSFEDGIFRVYINENEILFNQKISLNENDEVVFIKLTMLAGRLW